MSKIVFIGDSLTKGTDYGGVTTTDTFAHKIGIAAGYQACEILNKGIGSDTAAGVLARLQSDVIAHNPAVCVLMIGANDLVLGVTLASFKSTLEDIADALSLAGIKLVIMTTNLQRGSAAHIANQEQFVQATESIPCVGVVDVFRSMATKALMGDYLQFYVDTIHLTKQGHEYVASVATKTNSLNFFTA